MSRDATFQLDILDDLKSIELSDEFIEKNIYSSTFEEDNFRQTLNSLCESFVGTFLGDKDDTLALLHNFSKESATVLTDIEGVLQTFISQLESIQGDIGSVQKCLASKSTTLHNILSTETILSSAITRLVIPPEVVQVITQSNEEQLGTQFRQSVKELLRYLRHRSPAWKHAVAAASSRQTNGDADVSSHDEVFTNTQEMRIPFTECRVYNDLMDFMDSLTLYACWKIKSFLSHKLNVLMIKGTNIWIQQENVLKSFSFYVYFLQCAVSLLKRCPHHGPPAGAAKVYPTRGVKPHRLASALYGEFKAEYCNTMIDLYLKRIQEYVLTCRSMEFNTSLPVCANKVKGVGAASAGGGPSASLHVKSSFYSLPLITDTDTEDLPGLLRLGNRGEIFSRLFSPPLIPVMEKVNHRRHSYEETFRSLLSMMCDITTHEYLFTCEFFGGDPFVFQEVFRPTIQFIVDYVAEVVLLQCSGDVLQMLNGKSNTLVNESVEEDTYGLLIMIRLCYEFRSMMRYIRKLYCLDGFFDSLLQLLLPVYKENLEKQFAALRRVKPVALSQAMSALPSTELKLREVHPIVKSFTEFSCALMSILMGLVLSEERYRAEDELQREKLIGDGPLQSDGASSHAAPACEVPPAQDAIKDTFDELRELALQRFAEGDESEATDTKGEFTVLVSKLEFIQLNVIQLCEQLTQCILAEEKDAAVRSDLEPLQSCFVLNNIYFILQQYSQRQIVLSEMNSAECGEDDGLALGLKSDESFPLDIRDNFQDLKGTFLRYRVEFVENVIQKYVPAFFEVIQNGESCSVNQIREATDSFIISWQSALANIVKTVYQLISDPVNAQQIVAQICMDILLYNTRFHGIVAKALEKDRAAFDNCPLRSLIVTNQTVLQHMREFLSSSLLSINE